jgi:hypothetical protein
MPYKRIASALGISVATAHAWTRDVELKPEQIERNLRGPTGPQNPEHIRKRVDAWIRTARDKRVGYQWEGRAMARRLVPLHLAGCMLYWAEGAKERNCVKLTNSDVSMVAFFRQFLSTCFAVPDKRFAVTLNVYLGNGLSITEIEDHWLSALDLPRDCLRKHTINAFPTSSSGKKKNRLPYGVCALSVCDTRIVQHIYGAIQEYGGFEEPRWLDGAPRKPRRSAR